jgi:hypothetical protein
MWASQFRYRSCETFHFNSGDLIGRIHRGTKVRNEKHVTGGCKGKDVQAKREFC